VRAPRLTPLAAAALHVPAPERALVVGCGDGEPVLLLAREFPAARVRGVDPSPASVEAASSRVGLDPEARVAFKLGKPSSLPYPDDYFDLVAQVDGHPAPKEITRVLRRGGHLILACAQPARFAPGLRASLRRGRLGRQGIEAVWEESAGDGNFFVGRLVEPAATTAAI
jgi:ubiquinone/menaquinone biosynthesis C-methylase UbiE